MVLDLGVGPTTNSRLYDAYWSTGLQEDGWSAFGLKVPGRSDGDSLTLTVTNTGDSLMFYRAGVKVP